MGMKRFLIKTLSIAFIFFLILEVTTRFITDPLFFYNIRTYDVQKPLTLSSVYKKFEPTQHVDYLFVGSSRIPATINPQLFSKLSDGIAINAGRGYMTPGIHYQALKNKISQYPDYLRDAIVVIEYAGSSTYDTPFKEDKLKVYEPVIESDRPAPHLLIPHLDFNSYVEFMRESENGNEVKTQLSFLYFSSTYRSSQFVNEKFHALNKPLFGNKKQDLTSEGGIRDDRIEFAQQKALTIAKQQKERIINSVLLTTEAIDNSSFAAIYKLIVENGGRVVLYNMPLHSIQKEIYTSKKARLNKEVFEDWLQTKNIPVLYTSNFEFSDNDFPDTWHLSKSRRDEFTTKLFEQIKLLLAEEQ